MEKGDTAFILNVVGLNVVGLNVVGLNLVQTWAPTVNLGPPFGVRFTLCQHSQSVSQILMSPTKMHAAGPTL